MVAAGRDGSSQCKPPPPPLHLYSVSTCVCRQADDLELPPFGMEWVARELGLDLHPLTSHPVESTRSEEDLPVCDMTEEQFFERERVGTNTLPYETESIVNDEARKQEEEDCEDESDVDSYERLKRGNFDTYGSSPPRMFVKRARWSTQGAALRNSMRSSRLRALEVKRRDVAREISSLLGVSHYAVQSTSARSSEAYLLQDYDVLEAVKRLVGDRT